MGNGKYFERSGNAIAVVEVAQGGVMAFVEKGNRYYE